MNRKPQTIINYWGAQRVLKAIQEGSMLKDLNDNFAVDTDACEAFNEGPVVGSKVVDREAFLSHLEFAVWNHNFSKGHAPGQAFIVLPKTAFETVSAGDGPRSSNPDHYTLRTHRGRVGAYLLRELSGTTRSLAAVVYTRAAYLDDPEVPADALRHIDAKYIIVAVLAGCKSEAPPLTPHRLVANLAGGNNEALTWNAGEIRRKAEATMKHWEFFSPVAG